jgi:hypothetical protein
MKQLVVLMGLCGAVTAQPRAVLDAGGAERVLALEGVTHHVQGIDTDGDRLWVTAVDRPTSKGFLYEYSIQNGKRLHALELQVGERYHPGGIATDETSIWIPIAEYKAHSSALIQRRNKKTLEVEFEFSVPDHIGCIAVTPDLIIGGNWDSREFYIWNHEGILIRKIESQTQNSYQDLKFSNGRIVGSGTLVDHQGAVDWLDLASMKLTDRILVGEVDKGTSLAREGMAVRGDHLLFLPEDDASRLFVFRSITR